MSRYTVYSCGSATNTESHDEAMAQLKFFIEPAKSIHAGALLSFLGGSKKLASSALSPCIVTMNPRKLKVAHLWALMHRD